MLSRRPDAGLRLFEAASVAAVAAIVAMVVVILAWREPTYNLFLPDGIEPQRVRPRGAVHVPALPDEVIYVCEDRAIKVTDPNVTYWWEGFPTAGSRVDISPDGSRICYEANAADRNSQVFVSTPDGQDPRRVADHAAAPRWLDSDRIVYEWSEEGNDSTDQRSLWLADLRTGRTRRVFDLSAITPGGWAADIVVSPDRQHLLLTPGNDWRGGNASQDIYISDLTGRDVRAVWEDPEDDIRDAYPLWLPGDRLIWCRYSPGTYRNDWHMVAGAVSRPGFKPVADSPRPERPLAPSPDGRYVLFLRSVSAQHAAWRVWIMRSDGSGQRPFLTRDIPVDARACWGRVAPRYAQALRAAAEARQRAVEAQIRASEQETAK